MDGGNEMTINGNQLIADDGKVLKKAILSQKSSTSESMTARIIGWRLMNPTRKSPIPNHSP